MSDSATLVREAKKAATLHSIELHALRLTEARGLDGWTMDDLAEAVDVSRRTLFNYVAGKIEAIIGTPPINEATIDHFIAGGPTGDLIDDLGAVGHAILAEDGFDREIVALRRKVFLNTPKLIVAAHDRFEEIVRDFVDAVIAREGVAFGVTRARLLVRVMVVVFESAVERLETAPDTPTLAELYDESLAAARSLFAPTSRPH